jgi:hypothetical protein
MKNIEVYNVRSNNNNNHSNAAKEQYDRKKLSQYRDWHKTLHTQKAT